MLSIRNVTYTKCYLYEMLPIQSVLYEMLPRRNVTIRKCTKRNVTDPIIAHIVNGNPMNYFLKTIYVSAVYHL